MSLLQMKRPSVASRSKIQADAIFIWSFPIVRVLLTSIVVGRARIPNPKAAIARQRFIECDRQAHILILKRVCNCNPGEVTRDNRGHPLDSSIGAAHGVQ